MSGSLIPEQRPTKSDASIRAMKALSLNRAMSTTRPATAMKAQTNRLASRLKPGSEIIVDGQQVATVGPSSRHGRRGPPNRRNEAKGQPVLASARPVRGCSNRDPPLAAQNFPAALGLAVLDHHRLRIECDGRTNVPRNAVQNVAYRELPGARRLDDEVLFAVRREFGVRQVQQMHAWMGVFRRDRFVAEVEAKPVSARFADHASQHQGGGEKIQVGQLGGIAVVPEHAGPRATFDGGAPGMHRKGRSAADYNSRHGQSGLGEFVAQRIQRSEDRLASLRSPYRIGIAEVSVV